MIEREREREREERKVRKRRCYDLGGESAAPPTLGFRLAVAGISRSDASLIRMDRYGR